MKIGDQNLLSPSMIVRCCYCGLAIKALLTGAHLHGSEEKVPLCWTCHRAYDIDILTTDEIRAAWRATRAGTRRVNVSDLHRAMESDLARGRRKINKARQHKHSQYRAWHTRRARAAAGEPNSLQGLWLS